jgi:O-antigen biosynthesis protein
MFVPTLPVGLSPAGLPTGGAFSVPQAQPQPQPAPIAPPEADFDRALNYLADYSGCGHWRMIWPEQILNAHQKFVVHSTTMMVVDERYYQNTKAVRVQRQATNHQLQFIKLLKEFQQKHGFRLIYEIDDIVFHEDIPDYNKFKTAFTSPEIRESALAIMKEMDEITVTCEFMKEYYMSKTGNRNITVIPNYPPKWWMGHYYDRDKISQNYLDHKRKPRIIYPASGAHFDVDNRVNQRDDFYNINQTVINTINDFQWVFVGAFPLSLQSLVAQGKIEFHPWQRLYEYPALMNSLKPNMMVAPLQDNTFNQAKSDLKYIEACCYGIPIACQDLCTYKEAPYKFTTGAEMVDLIKMCMKSRAGYMKMSDAARAVADTRWLELDSNNDKYVELYRHPYMHPERKMINSLAANQ